MLFCYHGSLFCPRVEGRYREGFNHLRWASGGRLGLSPSVYSQPPWRQKSPGSCKSSPKPFGSSPALHRDAVPEAHHVPGLAGVLWAWPSSLANVAMDKPLLGLAGSWLKSAPRVLLGVCLQPEGFCSCASDISGGFVCWMAAGFAEVSSILLTGLLFLQWRGFIWWRRRKPSVQFLLSDVLSEVTI